MVSAIKLSTMWSTWAWTLLKTRWPQLRVCTTLSHSTLSSFQKMMILFCLLVSTIIRRSDNAWLTSMCLDSYTMRSCSTLKREFSREKRLILSTWYRFSLNLRLNSKSISITLCLHTLHVCQCVTSWASLTWLKMRHRRSSTFLPSASSSL